MKIYSINEPFDTKYHNITGTRNLRQEVNNKPIKINNTINCYPKNYYLNQIAFGFKSKLSANKLVAKIGEENFPSREIVKKLRDIGDSREFSLYDIHIEHYKDLLGCSTLDEAKQKYPEFKDVIDSKDIDYKSYPISSAIYRIGNKKVPGLDIKDLSLELLKRQYGQLISTAKKEFYYNLSYVTLDGLFNLLNIKKMNIGYIKLAVDSSTEHKKRNAKQTKKRWNNPNDSIRENQRAATQTDEFRETQREIQTEKWNKDVDGSAKKNLSEKLTEISHTPEGRASRSEAGKKGQAVRKSDPNYELILERNGELLSEAWNKFPEFKKMMSDIAKSYPGISSIRRKREMDIPLTKGEEKRLNSYFKECDLKMPGAKKLVAQEYRRLIAEEKRKNNNTNCEEESNSDNT